MKTDLERLPARFYRSESGREPVREWLKSLDGADRRVIDEDIKDVEFSWPIGMPLGSLAGPEHVGSPEQPAAWPVWLFSLERECMVLLHGFMKKTQKTPKQDIDLAIKRRKREGA